MTLDLFDWKKLLAVLDFKDVSPKKLELMLFTLDNLEFVQPYSIIGYFLRCNFQPFFVEPAGFPLGSCLHRLNEEPVGHLTATELAEIRARWERIPEVCD